MRQRFNTGNYWQRVLTGELRAETRRDGHPSPDISGEPFCTRSQIVAYFDAAGLRIAVVHQYLRPNGTIGGSGQPDPKMLIEDGIEYRPLPLMPSSSQPHP